MNIKKYENNVHQLTGDVTLNNDNNEESFNNTYVLKPSDKEISLKSKIVPGNSKQNNNIIYDDANNEEAIYDNEDFDDTESLYTDVTSINETVKTNVTSRSLSSEFSSFSLNDKNISDSGMKSEVNVIKFYHRNKLQLCPSRKKQSELKKENKTFTTEELMKIERENLILMQKILKISTPQTKMKPQYIQSTYSCSAINRKKFQRKIEEENLILLKKIQQARPHVIL
ncbi:cilia- and flagella-associated protein 97-like [Leptopilina heterotoma]|uniref:cilia- and flagella-associated protein 97-like n=1 Tax=Leptopilina heterotoma TaxID=63436 RepID=UPI001CA8615C|nr:cilia- and flagella-associated protein 97-like [Leptopilina heterotoma]